MQIRHSLSSQAVSDPAKRTMDDGRPFYYGVEQENMLDCSQCSRRRSIKIFCHYRLFPATENDFPHLSRGSASALPRIPPARKRSEVDKMLGRHRTKKKKKMKTNSQQSNTKYCILKRTTQANYPISYSYPAYPLCSGRSYLGVQVS